MTTYLNTESPAIQSAIEWALLHGFSLKDAPGSATHCAFTFAPTLMAEERFQYLKDTVLLAAKLIHAVSEDHDFLQQAMSPIAGADPFFDQLVTLHKKIHRGSQPAHRAPMLMASQSPTITAMPVI